MIKVHLDRLNEINPKLNSVIHTIEKRALEEAKLAEKKLTDDTDDNESYLGPFFGVPLVIKDNINTKDIKTTFGSKLYENYIPKEDAIMVARLKKAGAIIIGKTNLPEFALLAITDNILFGDTKNPWDYDKTPGGSSGGSAAAVAAGISPLSLGNDVGGSIRLPAAFCGVFGIKPTSGRIPCYPRLSGWEGLYHEGPITRNVADAAMMLDIMAGPDIRDRLTLPDTSDKFYDSLANKTSNLRIAYCSNLGYNKIDSEIKSITRESAKTFEKEGFFVDEIELNLPDMLKHLQNLTISDFLAAMEDDLEEWKEKMDPKYSGFFEMVEKITGQDISKIMKAKDELWEKIWPIFEKYDLLLTPTTAVPPFDFKDGGPVGPSKINGEKVSRMSWMGYTYPFNFTGQPAASINCGFTKDNLPVGLQIIGRHYDEKTVLKASQVFETIMHWR